MVTYGRGWDKKSLVPYLYKVGVNSLLQVKMGLACKVCLKTKGGEGVTFFFREVGWGDFVKFCNIKIFHFFGLSQARGC